MAIHNIRTTATELGKVYRDLVKESSGLFTLPDTWRFKWSEEVVSGVQAEGTSLKLVDLGGGMNLFNGVLARFGVEVTVFDIFEYDLGWKKTSGIDDFDEQAAKQKCFLEHVGVRFVNCDICTVDLTDYFEKETVHVITSYHCLEHLHQSPKSVLGSATKVLRSGGKMLLEVPNALNLKKRIDVLLGKTNYTEYDDYFFSSNYTGHVREYCVGDLVKLADHLNLHPYRIYGRNWYGTLFERLGDNGVSRLVDSALKLSPGLCGSLFLEYAKTNG